MGISINHIDPSKNLFKLKFGYWFTRLCAPLHLEPPQKNVHLSRFCSFSLYTSTVISQSVVSSFYEYRPFYEKMAFLSNPKIATNAIRWVTLQVSDSYIFVYILSTKRSESAMFRIISTICWTITNERINKSLKNQLTFTKHSSKLLDVKLPFWIWM